MNKEEDFDRLMRESFSRARSRKRQGRAQDGTQRCLSEETICDYLAARLPAGEQDKVEEHFSFCHACRQLLITLARVEHLERKELNALVEVKPRIHETTAGSRVISGIGAVVEALKISLAWVQEGLVLLETNADISLSQNTLMPSPIRGDLHQPKTDLGPFSKVTHGYKITAQVEKEREEKSCELRLNVCPPIGQGLESAIKVDVLQADRLLYSYPLEGDAVLVNGITPGEYEVRIRDANHLVALLSLAIKEE